MVGWGLTDPGLYRGPLPTKTEGRIDLFLQVNETEPPTKQDKSLFTVNNWIFRKIIIAETTFPVKRNIEKPQVGSDCLRHVQDRGVEEKMHSWNGLYCRA